MKPDAAARKTAMAAALLAVVMWGAVPVGTRFLVAEGAQRIPKRPQGLRSPGKGEIAPQA